MFEFILLFGVNFDFFVLFDFFFLANVSFEVKVKRKR